MACVPLVVLLLGSTAVAQRGGDFVRQETPPRTPVSGFPELLGTNQAAEGRLAAEFPFLGLDYGVTENFAVGTHLLATLVSELRGGMVRARYRFYSSGPVVSVVDGLGLYTWGETSVMFGWAGNHTSYYLSDRDVVTGSLLLGRLSVREAEDEPPGATTRTTLTMLFTALGYQRTLFRWLVLRANVYAIPLTLGDIDTSTGAASVTQVMDVTDEQQVLGRLMLTARWGSWLLSAGALTTGGLDAGPIFGVTKRW